MILSPEEYAREERFFAERFIFYLRQVSHAANQDNCSPDVGPPEVVGESPEEPFPNCP
jgi:hypothetical protein